MYQRKLLKAGVQLISITQQTSDDTAGEMQRHMIMLFDEYQSKEIAKHILRGMQENARQGYFNGSKAPFGYKTIDAGQTGTRGRMKKKLAIEEWKPRSSARYLTLYVHGKDAPAHRHEGDCQTSECQGHHHARQAVAHPENSRHPVQHHLCGWHTFNRGFQDFQIKDEAEWIKIRFRPLSTRRLFDKATSLEAPWSPKKCVPAP